MKDPVGRRSAVFKVAFRKGRPIRIPYRPMSCAASLIISAFDKSLAARMPRLARTLWPGQLELLIEEHSAVSSCEAPEAVEKESPSWIAEPIGLDEALRLIRGGAVFPASVASLDRRFPS